MSELAAKRQEILELLANGKLSADEAVAMLDSLGQPQASAKELAAEQPLVEKEPGLGDGLAEEVNVKSKAAQAPEAENGDSRPSWLHIRVSDARTGKDKVKVNLPMRLVRYGLAIGRRYAPEVGDLDWDEMGHYLGSEKGLLVDVLDEEDGEHVQIFLD